MRFSRLFATLLVLFLTTFSMTVVARADDDEGEEYDETARVVRISMTGGEVSLKRNGNSDWERARLNYPLVEGDSVSTDKDSRLEIQVDRRNFVRLAASSVLRIDTLRDEGIALTVIEGSATIRLAKFDRSKEYFEIDAPRTTLAAEQIGLYRIDVPKEGNVRLSVRDGGSARIYSETSGFVLRDGRSAELVASGNNAGDWEFTAAVTDQLDDWVTFREKYLAQHLQTDVQYFDEYVWGAEDLSAYGDWSYTSDYGWVWSPRSATISVYNDWAPYRYGHWTWCPPYGWTWVGYEPWGWAPYHYGRWVYHKNAWAWSPRSTFYRNRSWWRPALVAIVNLDFGNDFSWYPLDYHQRDPHCNYYTHHPDRSPRHWGDGRNDSHRGPWRGITSADCRRIGTEDLHPHHPGDQIARRIMGTPPLRGFPGRANSGNDAANPNRREWTYGRPGRVNPGVQIPDRPTGAGGRRPGIALDDELRRNRTFNGREPLRGNRGERPDSGNSENRPSGAVTRPVGPRETIERVDGGDRNAGGSGVDNGSRRRDRGNSGDNQPPRTGDGQRTETAPQMEKGSTEKPGRDRIKLDTPRSEPAELPATAAPPAPAKAEVAPQSNDAPPPQRIEQPQRVEQPQRSEPRVDRSYERPSRQSENYEPPADRPARVDRSESPRSESRRSESPRSESRSESPRSESPRSDSPRSESRRSESPRSESRSESPRSESRSESPRSESRSESPRSESRSESPRSESRSESPRSESPRSESPRSESPRSESPRSESPRSESPRSESPKSEPSKPDRP